MSSSSGVLRFLGLMVFSTSVVYGHGDNWKLVFHAVSGNGKSVLHAWNTMSPAVCTTDSGCLPLKFNLDNWRDNVTHLRSPLIDKWNSLNIVKIRVTFGGQGNIFAFLEFDGSGSNKLNWFSKSRLLHSSWSDLKISNTTYFSIKGDSRGCASNAGWFLVLDSTDGVCTWANNGNHPLFIYNKGSIITQWGQDHGYADIMHVYIQTV